MDQFTQSMLNQLILVLIMPGGQFEMVIQEGKGMTNIFKLASLTDTIDGKLGYFPPLLGIGSRGGGLHDHTE